LIVRGIVGVVVVVVVIVVVDVDVWTDVVRVRTDDTARGPDLLADKFFFDVI
jgi:hypothetical protein